MYFLSIWRYLRKSILTNQSILLKFMDTLLYSAFEVTNEWKFSIKIENWIVRCVDCFKIFDDVKWLISEFRIYLKTNKLPSLTPLTYSQHLYGIELRCL